MNVCEKEADLYVEYRFSSRWKEKKKIDSSLNKTKQRGKMRRLVLINLRVFTNDFTELDNIYKKPDRQLQDKILFR